MYILRYSPFPLYFLHAWGPNYFSYHFPSVLKNSYSNSLRTRLLIINLLVYFHLKISLFYFHSWRFFFAGCVIWIFSFSTWKMLHHFPLASWFLVRYLPQFKSLLTYMDCVVPLSWFEDLGRGGEARQMVSVFRNLIKMCQMWISLSLSYCSLNFLNLLICLLPKLDFFKLCFCKYFLASYFFSSSSVTLMKWMLYLFIFSQISEALDHFLKIHLLLWGWQASLVWSHGNRKGERAGPCAQLHFNTMLVTHMFTIHQWKQVTWLNSSNVRTIHPIHSGRLSASYGKTSLI